MNPASNIFEQARHTVAYWQERYEIEAGELQLAELELERMKKAFDPDTLIAACVPGGDSCDPQRVADALREYIALSSLRAVSVNAVTLACFLGDFPRQYGNSFSVLCNDGSVMFIHNMYHENLEHLLSTGVLSWPIDVTKTKDGLGIVCDSRIPESYLHSP